MFLQGILEIEQDSTQETDILDSTNSSYPYLASQDKNAGVETIKEREEGKITKISSDGKTLFKSIESLKLKPYNDQNGKEISFYIKL